MTTPANAALDTETLDRIANLLGNADEWSPASDYLEEIANLIADSGRNHPGGTEPDETYTPWNQE